MSGADLTLRLHVGKIANMKAKLLYRAKPVLWDGAIVEMVIWKVPPAARPMTTAIIKIQRDDAVALQDAGKGFFAAWKTGEAQDHVFSFSSP